MKDHKGCENNNEIGIKQNDAVKSLDTVQNKTANVCLLDSTLTYCGFPQPSSAMRVMATAAATSSTCSATKRPRIERETILSR